MDSTQKVPKKWYKKWWIWAIVVVVLIIIANGGDKNKQPAQTNNTNQPTQKEEVVALEVTSAKLVKDYVDNEIQADQTYKGKVLKVSGVVKSIGKDILDSPYVVLAGNSSDMFTDVQCMFNKKDEGELAKLVKNKQITLTGTGNGKLGNVLLRDCSL